MGLVEGLPQAMYLEGFDPQDPVEAAPLPPVWGGGDPFGETLNQLKDAPIPEVSFYIQDHLGNTRILYHTTFTDCNQAAVQYHLEHVADYYPFGKILREYVAQGLPEKFLTTQHERDIETGLDYRGARFYDCEVGRFLSVDPLAIDYSAWSPYSYTLDNPIQYVDPTGMWVYDQQEDGSYKRREGVENDGGEYVHTYVNNDGTIHYYNQKENTFVTVDLNKILQELQKTDKPSILMEAWNSDLARTIVPDIIGVGIAFNSIAGVGSSVEIQVNWVVRGPEVSWDPIITSTTGVGGGYSLDATLNIGGYNYMGDVSEIKRIMLSTNYRKGEGATYWFGGGVTAGGKGGMTFSYTPQTQLLEKQINIGAGIPAGPVPFNGSGGVSNTFILYDFRKP